MLLNIGCGADIIAGAINVDENSEDSRVVKRDIEEYIKELESNSVDGVKAHHVLEHVADLVTMMKEIHRVCKKGTTVDILVPLANTLWDVANPDHKRRFNHRTFQYFTRDFSTSDLGLFRGFEIIEQKIEREPNEWFQGIEWIVANLHTKLKVVK